MGLNYSRHQHESDEKRPLLEQEEEEEGIVTGRDPKRPVIVRFGEKNIRTTVTNKVKIVDKWINDYGQRKYGDSPIVGLATEGYFILPGRTQIHRAILQLCIGSNCLVYQIYKSDYIPHKLAEFLADTHNTFVGANIAYQVQLLGEDYGLTVSNIVDLKYLAASKLNSSLNERSHLTSLAEKFLHVELERTWSEHYFPDWRKECITTEQIQYASRVAAASYYVGLELSLIDAC